MNKENGSKSLLDIPRESNPTSDSELSPSISEEKDEISPFKRNTSLTISQRKKISPRINIQQILNSSDDSPGILNIDPLTHPLENSEFTNNINIETIDENSDKNANNLNANHESKG